MNKVKEFFPKHVGLIPDGGRRWAHQNQCSYSEAYSLSMQLITEFVEMMFMEHVQSVSVYLLSKENLRRKATDLEPVFLTEVDLITRLLPPVVEELEVQVFHAGQTGPLPVFYADAISELCQRTSANRRKQLYLLIAYDPFDELRVAIGKSAKRSIDLKELWVPVQLDFVVRTSGEKRLSNFLPLQSGYAEFLFVQRLFNDLSKEDFEGFLLEYKERKRRFGE